MILQRAGVIAAGLTMATIFGLAGAGPLRRRPRRSSRMRYGRSKSRVFLGVNATNSAPPATRSSRTISRTLELGAAVTGR